MEELNLNDSKCTLRIHEGQLIVEREREIIGTFPIVPVKRINVFGNPQITTQAVKACLEEGVEIRYFSVYGKFLGCLSTENVKNISTKLAQYRSHLEPVFRLQWSRALISAKLKGYEVEYRRIADNHWNCRDRNFLPLMHRFREKAMQSQSIPELLGIEGYATREYFRYLSHSMPEGFSFEKRTRNPPEDPVNAMLSFTYSLCAGEIRSMICRKGFDSQLSFTHQIGYGTGGLAWDLLECFRPAFCDHSVLKLLHSSQQAELKFQTEEKRCMLADKTRQILILHFQKSSSARSSLYEKILQRMNLWFAGTQDVDFLQFLPEK